MTAGRFVEVKGHRFLLDALAQLPVRLNDRPVRLLLLGDGILGPRLREQAARLGVDERIVWAGWQSDPAPFYEIADLVVFPSLEQETLGNVILEAWAHRKPIVVSRFRGAREITRDGVDAWQVPCEDAIELAAGVRHVAGQPGLAAAMAEQGFDQVRRDFSRAAVAGAYIDLYGELRRRQGRRDVA
jgi:glycosyltransferase involved in cell wall biosynthesis